MEGAGNTRRHGVRGGERKKFSQRKVPRKASKVTFYREIVERIRCPEGSQKEAKKAFTDWHLSFHVLPQKWALAILGPRENTTQKIPRDGFGLPSGGLARGNRDQKRVQTHKTKLSPTWSSQFRPPTPISVQREQSRFTTNVV